MPGDTSSAVAFHSLPIKTCFEGTTNVTENFPSDNCRGGGPAQEVRTNYFRGRFLQGKTVHVPEEYSIALMSFSKFDHAADIAVLEEPSEKEALLVAENNRIFVSSDHFMLWEHDREPENVESISNWMASGQEADLIQSFEDRIAYSYLPASLRQRFSPQDFTTRFVHFSILRNYAYYRLPDHIRTCITEGEYYEEMIRFGGEQFQLYPYAHQKSVIHYTKEIPLTYYVRMVGEMLKNENSYDRLPNFTAIDILNLVGIGRNQYLNITKEVRSKIRWHINRNYVTEHLPTEYLPSVNLDPFWEVNCVEMAPDAVRRWAQRLSTDALALYRLLAARGSTVVPDASSLQVDPQLFRRQTVYACELPSAPLHELYRCGLLYATFSVSPDDCLIVPPLGSFVMNRTSSEPQEILLYRILSTVDERTSLGQLSQLLMLDEEDVCAAVELLIQLRLARLKLPTIPETVQQHPEDVVHPSWQTIFQEVLDEAKRAHLGAGALLASPKGGEGGHPVKRIALLYDATLTGFLMMTNLSKDPGFKQHAVTLFEVGKMPSDAVSNFLELLDGVDMKEIDTFSGEAQKYVNSVICLRNLLKALMPLRGPEGGMGVDMYKIEALNELEATTRYSLLGRNFWAYVITSPVSCTPLIDVELCCVYGGTVSLMPSPWFLLFLYTKVKQGPPSLLVPFGALLHSWPPVFTDTQKGASGEEHDGGCVGHVSKVRCQAMTLDAEVTYGELDTSLLLLSEMTFSAPVLVQCAARVKLLRQSDGRVIESPHEKTMEISVPFDCTAEELDQLIAKKVAALFGTRAAVAAMSSGSIIPLLAKSTEALHLAHSLGYFTLSIVCCMQTSEGNDANNEDHAATTAAATAAGADNEDWNVPASAVTLESAHIVSIGLGVPLFDVDCCALIIKRIPHILSDEETTQHNESIRKCVAEFGEFLETYSSLTRQVHEMMAIQSTATAGPMTQQHLRKMTPTGGAPFPSTMLLFDGTALRVVDDANALSDQW